MKLWMNTYYDDEYDEIHVEFYEKAIDSVKNMWSFFEQHTVSPEEIEVTKDGMEDTAYIRYDGFSYYNTRKEVEAERRDQLYVVVYRSTDDCCEDYEFLVFEEYDNAFVYWFKTCAQLFGNAPEDDIRTGMPYDEIVHMLSYGAKDCKLMQVTVNK